jgi:hypothetical protein
VITSLIMYNLSLRKSSPHQTNPPCREQSLKDRACTHWDAAPFFCTWPLGHSVHSVQLLPFQYFHTSVQVWEYARGHLRRETKIITIFMLMRILKLLLDNNGRWLSGVGVDGSTYVKQCTRSTKTKVQCSPQSPQHPKEKSWSRL